MRVVAAASALLLLGFGGIVTARAGLLFRRWRRASRKLIWVVVAYMAVGAVWNAITSSEWERLLWLPMTLALGMCALLVTRGE